MDNMVKTLCIVQARLTSSRLPNKVLMKLGASGLSIAEHVYQRLNMAEYIDKIVFAIPETPANDALALFFEKHEIAFERGSEDDVLDRFFQCAQKYRPEVIVRATCDNPFVDWIQLDNLISHLPGYDYVSSLGAPLGTSAEVFLADSLYQAHANAVSGVEKEHVTPYIYRHPELFKIAKVPYHLDVVKERYRLTVDTEQDFVVVNELYESLYRKQPIRNDEVYMYLESHQELRLRNISVIQKSI